MRIAQGPGSSHSTLQGDGVSLFLMPIVKFRPLSPSLLNTFISNQAQRAHALTGALTFRAHSCMFSVHAERKVCLFSAHMRKSECIGFLCIAESKCSSACASQ